MSYCDWDTVDELCLRYHDEEWGVPCTTTAGSSSSSRSRLFSAVSIGP